MADHGLMELSSAAPSEHPPTMHIPVTSSSIASVGYRGRERVLEVRFKRGAVYEYLDVPEDVFVSLLTADSMGRFFNQAVRSCFEHRRR
jgi:hypothetical protein